ncbi:hypothetical protein LEP1GSC133_2788 [Leptospira borgpetersenii serovar Pomona str. 200901868]|uniref:Uncharacterized protein n=1 Tax=Leptospira borgpetersenii serovar Pomona str. 200901868 TaxID=1192866 RepID=M6WT19_LEPBO|nr:hypothetical protein LEP1GSC133_2788 [Leptospira borgpetersenii serovar Pomona str. 200901868]
MVIAGELVGGINEIDSLGMEINPKIPTATNSINVVICLLYNRPIKESIYIYFRFTIEK